MPLASEAHGVLRFESEGSFTSAVEILPRQTPLLSWSDEGSRPYKVDIGLLTVRDQAGMTYLVSFTLFNNHWLLRCSGGKDSIYNLQLCQDQGHEARTASYLDLVKVARLKTPKIGAGYPALQALDTYWYSSKHPSSPSVQNLRCALQVVALANLLPGSSDVDEVDSFMYQTVGHQLVESHAACMNLPLFRQRISGTAKQAVSRSTHQTNLTRFTCLLQPCSYTKTLKDRPKSFSEVPQSLKMHSGCFSCALRDTSNKLGHEACCLHPLRSSNALDLGAYHFGSLTRS